MTGVTITQRNSLIAVLLVLLVSFGCACPLVSAYELFPWGLRRIHSDCVWDNDHNETIESEDDSRAGVGVKVAVIDNCLWFAGL